MVIVLAGVLIWVLNGTMRPPGGKTPPTSLTNDVAIAVRCRMLASSVLPHLAYRKGCNGSEL